MKAYKIDLSLYKGKVREVISEAVQRKAFELGYSWDGGQNIKHTDAEFLFFGERGGIGFDTDLIYFKKTLSVIISAADFLALTTAKDEAPFNPFDKVLVRDADNDGWIPALYSKKNNGYHVIIGSSSWIQCVPYEGNEHLIGTTEEAK